MGIDTMSVWQRSILDNGYICLERTAIVVWCFSDMANQVHVNVTLFSHLVWDHTITLSFSILCNNKFSTILIHHNAAARIIRGTRRHDNIQNQSQNAWLYTVPLCLCVRLIFHQPVMTRGSQHLLYWTYVLPLQQLQTIELFRLQYPIDAIFIKAYFPFCLWTISGTCTGRVIHVSLRHILNCFQAKKMMVVSWHFYFILFCSVKFRSIPASLFYEHLVARTFPYDKGTV